jgi:DNA-binding transcriptional MocR family regulator
MNQVSTDVNNPSARDVIVGTTASEIAASVERGIEDGNLRLGDTLESVREMAARLEVSPATVASAYRTLRDRGLVTTHERRRTRVSLRPPLPTRTVLPLADSVRDLASGNPDPGLLPSLSEYIKGLGMPVRLYGEQSSLPDLVSIVRDSLEIEGTHAEMIAVVNGGLEGIERVLAASLKPGDYVAVEDPCYTGVLDLVRAMGFIPRPVALDDEGLVPEQLASALAAGASALVVTPRGQNPTGAALSVSRGQKLERILVDHPDLLVIEDDHATGITTVPRISLTGSRERWAVVRSLSKAYGPDLRIAFVAGDRLTVNRVEGRQLLGCGWVSHVLQRLLLRMLSDQAVKAAVNHAAGIYDTRRTSLTTALTARGIRSIGRSGFNIWIPVVEEEIVVRGLMQLGWAIRGGEAYRLLSPPGIRVTASALEPGEAIMFADDLARIVHPVERTRLA